MTTPLQKRICDAADEIHALYDNGFFSDEIRDQVAKIVEAVVLPRCEMCKYWAHEAASSYYSPHAVIGVCTYACNTHEPKMRGHHGYEDILTTPDFGCVEWEAK